MLFTDSHCHLDFTEFDQSISELLLLCESKSIHRIIVPGVNPQYWQRIISLSEKLHSHVKVSCALGIHPWFLILQDNTSPTSYDLSFQEQQLKQAIKKNIKNVEWWSRNL